MKAGEATDCGCACRRAPVLSNSKGASRWAMAAAPRAACGTLLVGMPGGRAGIVPAQAPAQTPCRALSVIHLLQDGGFDFPLDALAGGGQPIDADRAHAARRGVMGHQPGLEFPRPAGREAEQQIDAALGNGVRPVDTLVADDEVAVAHLDPCERALLRQHLEERLDERARPGPGWRRILLEQDPACAALDARSDPQA